MATPDYNIPPDFENTISFRLAQIYPELQQFKDESEFIYAGLGPGYTILRRTQDSIIQQVTEAYMRGKRKIFFDGVDESIINIHNRLITLHKVSSYITDLYPDVVCTLIVGSANSKEEYLKICTNLNIKPSLEVLSCYFFERLAKERYIHFISYFNFEYSLEPRKKIFTCLNRVLRFHRIELLDKLLGKNLVNENCYYSFYDGNIPNGNLDEILNYPSVRIPNILEHADLVKTLRLNFDEERINPADLRQEDFYLYQDSYFSVIPETVYYTKNFANEKMEPTSTFFSEKTYKPIMMQQPFILVAVSNSLSVLRERGYKTFHPYIDETYDTITDDQARLNCIVNEIERLSKKTEIEWLQWLKDVKPIVEHNIEVLKSNDCFIQNKDLIGRLQSI